MGTDRAIRGTVAWGILVLVVGCGVGCGSEGDGSGSPTRSRRPVGGDSDATKTDDAERSNGSNGSGGDSDDGHPSDSSSDTGTPTDPSTDPGTSDTGSNEPTGPEDACVGAINGYRAKLGLPAFTRWTDGEACASTQAQSDSSTGKAHGAFGQCDEWAQTECPGWPGPSGKMIGSCIDAMWKEGPGGGHYDILVSKKYQRVACGYFTKPDGKVWAVQNFQ